MQLASQYAWRSEQALGALPDELFCPEELLEETSPDELDVEPELEVEPDDEDELETGAPDEVELVEAPEDPPFASPEDDEDVESSSPSSFPPQAPTAAITSKKPKHEKGRKIMGRRYTFRPERARTSRECCATQVPARALVPRRPHPSRATC